MRYGRSPFTKRARFAWLLVGALALGGTPACSTQSPPASTDAEADAEPPGEVKSELLERRGFYQRRETGNGRFLTRTEMARSRLLSDALREVPGIDVISGAGGALVVSGRSTGRCPLAVFVDGSYTTIRNVDELTLEGIEAVEVYRGPAEIPAGFNAPVYDRTCGALLVWSRIEVGD